MLVDFLLRFLVMVSALYLIANAALTPFGYFSKTPESEYICTNDRFLLFDFVTV